MEIVKKKISDLISPDYNPRRQNQKMYNSLKRSIEEHWLIQPLIVNINNGNVVWWNQRLLVLRDLWRTEVDIVEVDLDDEWEKKLNIALNKIDFWFDKDKLWTLLWEFDEIWFDDIELMGLEESDLKLLEDTMKEDVPEYEVARETFEHHDYVLFHFDNQMDFQNVQDKLWLERVKEFGNSTSNKTWVWRAMDWRVLLDLIANYNPKKSWIKKKK